MPMHGVFNAALFGSVCRLCLALFGSVCRLCHLAMKGGAKKGKAKGQQKVQAKAKAKGKAKGQQKVRQEVQKVAQEDAQKVAQMPKKVKAVAKAVKKKPSCAEQKSPMKKPSSWDQWADDGEDEEEKGEDSKDCSVPTKAQAYIFERALKMDPGTRGALPSEIHELWNSMQKGPGAAQERHALRNAIVPRDATYGHICKVDPTGSLMQRVRNVWETKQKKIQLKGMSESEMLWKSFQGNEVAMQSAIDKGHIQVQNDMYIWQREIHEHISGGTDSYSSGPQQMTQQDMQKLLELLHYAPWVDWALVQNVPSIQLKTAATPDSDAIQKAHECLDASKAVCLSMETFYKGVQSQGILSMQDTGSIPVIMSTAMKKVKAMQTEHMQPIADIIYNHDGTCSTSVKEVKDMLGAAAKTLQALTQYMSEAKALVQKYKAAHKDKKAVAARPLRVNEEL
jgi:hypothetical protein